MTKKLEAVSSSINKNLESKNADNSKSNKIIDVNLPSNIKEWRASHVQAWLAFTLNLKQYLILIISN